jgi:ribosome-associated heat shock protein Hsp15
MRLDKWLWAARFYKTRSLATDEIGKGRVKVNGADVKPAKEVRAGDEVALRNPMGVRTVRVQAVSGTRGPAPVAQLLYEETPESIATRERAQEQRRLAPEPASSIAQGRPTKRDRRDLDGAQSGKDGWGGRWSASVDD